MPKPRQMNWRKMITEIVELDPKGNWTYTTIGERAGTSRSTIGRLMADPAKSNYIEEPKWSQGMALIELHAEVREKHKRKQQRT